MNLQHYATLLQSSQMLGNTRLRIIWHLAFRIMATTKGFRGAFNGSTKQSDGGVKYMSRDGNKVTVVVEAGFSEYYSSLCRRKDMWIDGDGVKCLYIALSY
ncbi:hypothetical protein V1517DRAFT_170588 [Lipomyces orientalis]|uniref:Uncharacterized protein n=1 Tax=Lipomyces orientalis TaxID=1233043 RepID=A0ACC3TKA2_9ASCO